PQPSAVTASTALGTKSKPAARSSRPDALSSSPHSPRSPPVSRLPPSSAPRLLSFPCQVLHSCVSGVLVYKPPPQRLMDPGVDPPAHPAQSLWPEPCPSNHQGSWTQVRDGCPAILQSPDGEPRGRAGGRRQPAILQSSDGEPRGQPGVRRQPAILRSSDGPERKQEGEDSRPSYSHQRVSPEGTQEGEDSRPSYGHQTVSPEGAQEGGDSRPSYSHQTVSPEGAQERGDSRPSYSHQTGLRLPQAHGDPGSRGSTCPGLTGTREAGARPAPGSRGPGKQGLDLPRAHEDPGSRGSSADRASVPGPGPLSPAASQDAEQVAARQALPDPPWLPAPDLRRPHLSWEVAAPGIWLPFWPRGKKVPTHLSNCQGHMCRLATPRVQSQPPDLLLPSPQDKPDTHNFAGFLGG
ncbi:unnamed protein product, partial [Rangifer tarandus platyrhynchus]